MFISWLYKNYPEITHNYINSLKIENKNENEYYYEYDENKLLLDIEPLMIFNLDIEYNKIIIYYFIVVFYKAQKKSWDNYIIIDKKWIN